MKVLRKMKIDTDEFIVGDQINVGHYMATCQKVDEDGYIFLLDQYLDEPMSMNDEDTSDGGYEESDLRKRLNSAEILDIFVSSDFGNMLIPFDNGDLLRIPHFGEIFGNDDLYKLFVEQDGYEQWPLMKHRPNRITGRNGFSCEYGWVQNKCIKNNDNRFCCVGMDGFANDGDADLHFGVRPVFKIGKMVRGQKDENA